MALHRKSKNMQAEINQLGLWKFELNCILFYKPSDVCLIKIFLDHQLNFVKFGGLEFWWHKLD